jgi:hypothetical protein
VGKRFVLSEYLELVMGETVYDELEDGAFSGEIPDCRGVLVRGPGLAKPEGELRSGL